MRGKEDLTNKEFAAVRITPAHAGKRVHYLAYCAYMWDHPRPCGEKIKCLRKKRLLQGSPPPMRGKACSGIYRRS